MALSNWKFVVVLMVGSLFLSPRGNAVENNFWMKQCQELLLKSDSTHKLVQVQEDLDALLEELESKAAQGVELADLLIVDLELSGQEQGKRDGFPWVWGERVSVHTTDSGLHVRMVLHWSEFVEIINFPRVQSVSRVYSTRLEGSVYRALNELPGSQLKVTIEMMKDVDVASLELSGLQKIDEGSYQGILTKSEVQNLEGDERISSVRFNWSEYWQREFRTKFNAEISEDTALYLDAVPAVREWLLQAERDQKIAVDWVRSKIKRSEFDEMLLKASEELRVLDPLYIEIAGLPPYLGYSKTGEARLEGTVAQILHFLDGHGGNLSSPMFRVRRRLLERPVTRTLQGVGQVYSQFMQWLEKRHR